MTAKAGNPEAKRKINDKLAEKLAPFDQPMRGKKEARERQEVDHRRAAQRSCKKRRSARSTSTVEDAGRTRNGSKKALVQDTCQKTIVG